jgi:hypothetical protein
MDVVKNYIDHIENSLSIALSNALLLQKHVEETEGDSDLYRKLAYYLSPSLNHWMTGAQAGNMKDLRELLNRRIASQGTTMATPGQQGDGHEVLTKPSK